MKKKGSTSDFMMQRDRELHAHFMRILTESVGVPLREMYGMAARCPASRFWVSEMRATDMISLIIRGCRPANQKKQSARMYDEIYRRVQEWQAENPGHTLTDAVCAVVNSPAPEFYITDKSAKIIIYRHRRRNRSNG